MARFVYVRHVEAFGKFPSKLTWLAQVTSAESNRTCADAYTTTIYRIRWVFLIRICESEVSGAFVSLMLHRFLHFPPATRRRPYTCLVKEVQTLSRTPNSRQRFRRVLILLLFLLHRKCVHECFPWLRSFSCVRVKIGNQLLVGIESE